MHRVFSLVHSCRLSSRRQHLSLSEPDMNCLYQFRIVSICHLAFRRLLTVSKMVHLTLVLLPDQYLYLWQINISNYDSLKTAFLKEICQHEVSAIRNYWWFLKISKRIVVSVRYFDVTVLFIQTNYSRSLYSEQQQRNCPFFKLAKILWIWSNVYKWALYLVHFKICMF